MAVLKYVNMFNQGVKRVQDMLRENGNKEAAFDVSKLTVFCVEVYSNEEEYETSEKTSEKDFVNDVISSYLYKNVSKNFGKDFGKE